MAYLVAVGTSDGENIDQKFGEVKVFSIYKVDENQYSLLEMRKVQENADSIIEASCEKKTCDSNGCSGNGHGCGGPSGVMEKVEMISDCRCVLCAKVGFQGQKQFERKAISVFDISCCIEEALNKILFYYEKQDNHKSLRKE